MSETRRIDDITLGPRFRRHFGDIAGLAASIRELGLLQPPGVTPDGRLLWGECRLRACRSLGWTEIPVLVRDVDPGDFVAIEAAENFARKDFTLSEAVAIKRAMQPNLPKFGRSEPARETVAGMTGFSHETLRKAEDIVSAVEREPERFGRLLIEMDRTARVDAPFKQLRVARERDAYLARKVQGGSVADLATLAASGFRAAVILLDVPWPFDTWGERGKIWTSVDNHYDAMTLDAIKALPVASLALDNCALFFWCTWPLLVLGHPLDVVRAWGFEPKTLGFDWIKTNPSGDGLHWGAGYFTRSNAEPCLLATRGSPRRMATDVHQVIMAPVGAHSAKPDEAHERIERLFNGPYLELFARKARPGWVTWGDELPSAAAAE